MTHNLNETDRLKKFKELYETKIGVGKNTTADELKVMFDNFEIYVNKNEKEQCSTNINDIIKVYSDNKFMKMKREKNNAFIVLTKKDTGNNVWYFQLSPTKITRQMGLNEDTTMYSHIIENNVKTLKKWVMNDLENDYVSYHCMGDIFNTKF